MVATAASIEAALVRACAAMGDVEKIPALCIELHGVGSWVLSDDGDGRAVVEARTDDTAAMIRSDASTLALLATGRLSPLTALATGRLKLESRGVEREKLGRWFPALRAAGESILAAQSFSPKKEQLTIDGLTARVVGVTKAKKLGYVVSVTGRGTSWTVTRTYSEFRALWLTLGDERSREPVTPREEAPVTPRRPPPPLDEQMPSVGLFATCASPPPLKKQEELAQYLFPRRRLLIGQNELADREVALDSWLQRTCHGDADELYAFLDAGRSRCEESQAWRRADDALTLKLPYDAATAQPKLKLWRDLAAARKKKKEDPWFLSVVLWSLLGLLCWFCLVSAGLLVIFPARLLLHALLFMLPPPKTGCFLWVVWVVFALLAEEAFFGVFVKKRLFFAMVGFVLRCLCDVTGLSRACHVNCTAGLAISSYVTLTLMCGVFKLKKGNEKRKRYFEMLDSVLAPFVASRLLRLGSIWVKLGQYLSARSDVVSGKWKAALTILQDEMPFDSLGQVKRTLRQSGLAFEPGEAIASASIAQVHVAYANDAKIALKLQHEGIAPIMKMDIERAIVIARVCAWLNEDFEPTATILLAWRSEIGRELDLRHEAASMREARLSFQRLKADVVLVAEPLAASEKVLAMEFINDAFKIDQTELYALFGLDKQLVVETFAHLICCQIFDNGFFNADPHPGNVLVALCGQEAGAKICLLDWGWTHRLSETSLEAWRDLALAMPELDTKAAIDALGRLGYSNNQDSRAPERSVQFFQFLFRDTSGKTAADADKDRLFAMRKEQKTADEKAGLREKGGRKLTQIPDSFLFVVRVIGALRGLAAHLDVTIPLSDIMALHARRGKLRGALQEAALGTESPRGALAKLTISVHSRR